MTVLVKSCFIIIIIIIITNVITDKLKPFLIHDIRSLCVCREYTSLHVFRMERTLKLKVNTQLKI